MGAEMGQQVIEPAVHAALIQGDDKQEPPSRQRTLQAGQHLCLPPRQGRLQHSGAPGESAPPGRITVSSSDMPIISFLRPAAFRPSPARCAGQSGMQRPV